VVTATVVVTSVSLSVSVTTVGSGATVVVVDGIVIVLVDSGLLVDSSLLALTDVAAIEITPTSATVPISHFGARGRPRVALVGNAGGVSIEVIIGICRATCCGRKSDIHGIQPVPVCIGSN